MLLDRRTPLAPAPLTLRGRDRELASLLDLVAQGASVDVVGRAGSGKTRFLDAAAARLEEGGARPVRVRGIEGLRGHPLAALHVAGFGAAALARDQRPVSSVQHVVDALDAVTSGAGSVLVIDDAGHLDESSLGVVETIRARHALPVVAAYTGSAAIPGAMRAGRRLELGPLAFDQLQAVAVARAGGPIEQTTLSRLYADSSGTVGVALALLDTGLRTGALTSVDGVWRAESPLWDPSLLHAVTKQLSGLGETEREALEAIALLGDAEVAEILLLYPEPVVQRLESASLIQIVADGDAPLVTVVAPLVAEAIRHAPPTMRRLRVAERVQEVLGSSARLHSGGGIAHAADPSPDSDAVLVRLIRERARAARRLAVAEWALLPDAANASALLRSLLVGGASEEEVRTTLAATTTCVDTSLVLPELRAVCRVALGDDLHEAEQELRSAAARSEAAGATVPPELVEAAVMRLQYEAGRIPVESPLEGAVESESANGMAASVRSRVLASELRLSVALGRTRRAAAVHAQLSAEHPDAVTPQLAALATLGMLADGAHAHALARARSGMRSARAAVSGAGLRAHGFVATLAYAVAGRYAEAEEVIAQVMALGMPSAAEEHDHFRLLAVAQVVAARRDNADLLERLKLENRWAERSAHPMAVVATGWHAAQSLAYSGAARPAADVLARLADDLWERNERLFAAFTLLSSVELHHETARLATAAEWVDTIDGELLHARLAFLTARNRRDAQAMLALPARLQASGSPGLAVLAFRLVAEWSREEGNTEAAAEADTRREAFVASLGAHPCDTVRFSAVAVNLTDREREIGRLVAQGLTNPQIAAQLVLSVRTVESHLHRIMRKTAVANRSELAGLMSGSAR